MSGENTKYVFPSHPSIWVTQSMDKLNHISWFNFFVCSTAKKSRSGIPVVRESAQLPSSS